MFTWYSIYVSILLLLKACLCQGIWSEFLPCSFLLLLFEWQSQVYCPELNQWTGCGEKEVDMESGWRHPLALGLCGVVGTLEANQCPLDLLITCSWARPPVKFKAQLKALQSEASSLWELPAQVWARGAVVMASSGAAFLEGVLVEEQVAAFLVRVFNSADFLGSLVLAFIMSYLMLFWLPTSRFFSSFCFCTIVPSWVW